MTVGRLIGWLKQQVVEGNLTNSSPVVWRDGEGEIRDFDPDVDFRVGERKGPSEAKLNIVPAEPDF